MPQNNKNTAVKNKEPKQVREGRDPETLKERNQSQASDRGREKKVILDRWKFKKGIQ